MQEYAFTLRGVTPLIMHADNIVEADALEEWRKQPENRDKSKAGDDRTPAWTWNAYLDHDGEYLALPQANLLRSLRDAGVQLKLKGHLTFKRMTQIGLRIATEFCTLKTDGHQVALMDILAFRYEPFTKHVEHCKELGIDLFCKRATVGKSKHIRVRPRFKTWSVEGSIIVTEDVITEDILNQLFYLAGRYSGLGDWRPSSPKSPGPFGLFTAAVEAA